jgi:catechol 2,3-dioxygenase-like lactoylglutathione lyase family enzyme
MADIRITEMDHIVLNVRDVEASLAFYVGVLGLKGERVEEFRRGEVGFPSVRVNADTIIDLSTIKNAANELATITNLAHYCLVADPTDLAALAEQLRAQGVSVRQGPVPRWGARGRATSIYIADPDGNEIEIRCY